MNNIFLCSYFKRVASNFNDIFGKNRKKVCFVATAAKYEVINFYVSEAKDSFLSLGYEIKDVDISNLNATRFDEILKDSDFLYFSGGNTFYLLSEIYKNGLADCISKFLQNGGIYIGESAGAIIASPDIKYAQTIDENRVNLKDFKALNLVPFYTLPHYKEEPFIDICDEILSKFENLKAINNSQFILANWI